MSNNIINNESLTLPINSLLTQLQTRTIGLGQNEVIERQKKYGLNVIHKKRLNVFSTLTRQFIGNPLLAVLVAATFISYLLGQHISSYYIFGMIMVSIILGFFNEYSAEKTIDTLLKKISHSALVLRNGEKKAVPVSQLTIGDIVVLAPGDIVPADLRLIETSNLELDQSTLTGEAKTVYKNESPPPQKSVNIADSPQLAFMGTTIENGEGRGVVIKIGKETEFGKIAQSTTYLKPTTEFQKGISKFGQLIVKVILVLTVAIFGINALLGHQILESLLFSLAIAVGLTPELLPVIITTSLSHGAGKLAKKHVVVKRLISIENLGNMDVLCTDKTGTLTEGKIKVQDYFDENGQKDPNLLASSLFCNSAIIHHKIIGNGIDTALWEYAQENNFKIDKKFKKLHEEKFNYDHKSMFTVIEKNGKIILICKGAPEIIVNLCPKIKDKNAQIAKFQSLSKDGLRVIAIASKEVTKSHSYNWKDFDNLTFDGFVTFLDTPKKTAKEALLKLKNLNVQTKIITGDNEIVTEKICREVGMEFQNILLGSEIEALSDKSLEEAVNKTTIFARVNPNQKLKIIQALQSIGHTVGYLGDGINDIPSLHCADIGISVDTSQGSAKEAASVILLRKDLNVIADGIVEGRKTFNNTIKYILMGTSSNFGNMFSAAGASFFLPFLPMTPIQILLTNGLYDISQMSIPTDNVDAESLLKPRHWNINFIKNYMIFFGPLSSIYDFLTYGVMIFIFHAKGSLFQTGWFIESIATEVLVVFIIRTARRPFFKSRPSIWLTITCISVVAIGAILPFSPFAKQLGFVTPPPLYFAILVLLTATYLLLVETVKMKFLKKFSL